MRILLFLICFLIISCDLPSEGDKDCNGIQSGLAEIDDCGICSGGLTAYSANSNKDCCGDCFGEHFDCEIPCFKCGDQEAVTSNNCTFDFNIECEGELDSCCGGNKDSCSEECEYIYQHDSDMCIYNLCTDYFESNDDFSCDTQGSPPYTLEEQLSCESLETEFSMCYPECDNLVKLADFEDKIIFIIYEEDW